MTGEQAIEKLVEDIIALANGGDSATLAFDEVGIKAMVDGMEGNMTEEQIRNFFRLVAMYMCIQCATAWLVDVSINTAIKMLNLTAEAQSLLLVRDMEALMVDRINRQAQQN